ncbi:MAG: hypothetical protein RLZZ165_1569 [Bacteroidota bacterium]|jgi:hypothetical protein
MPKGTPSRTERWVWNLLAYFRRRLLLTLVAIYMLGTTLLLAATGIDICIPCLWTAVLGVHCPGCGLTRAAVHLVHLDPAAAWATNPLIYLLVPAGMYFVAQDFRRSSLRPLP